MTREERIEKLRHFITCMKCEVSGKCCDDNCPTQYAAGNMGEIIENLEEIAKILEQEPCDHYTEGYFKGYDDGQKGKLEQQPCEDAISRQGITEYLQRIVAASNTNSQYNEGFVDGIEFCITNISTMPPVTLQPKTDMLDKIRAEIEELDGKYVIGDYGIYGENIPKYVRFWDVLQIIDKYKAESEDK